MTSSIDHEKLPIDLHFESATDPTSIEQHTSIDA